MSLSNSKAIRVVYLHGLESGPHGNKALFLHKHFNTAVTDFNVSLWNLKRENGIFRRALVHPATCICVLATVMSFGALSRTVGCGVALLSTVIFKRYVLPRALRTVIENNIAAAARTIEAHRPHVVVGSSWGGGVATFLLERKMWNGPTVLLAPAHGIVRQRTEVPGGSGSTIAAPVLILHSPVDSVVPMEHSVALSGRCPNGRLEVVENDAHPLNSTLEGGTASVLYRAIVNFCAVAN